MLNLRIVAEGYRRFSSTWGLLLSLADGIKSAFVRCSAVVPAESSLFGFLFYLQL